MSMNDAGHDSLCTELFFRCTCQRDRNPKKADDRCAGRRSHGDVGAHDDIGHKASLAIRRIGKRPQQRPATEGIAFFHGIADSVDMRVTCLLTFVHHEGTA